MESEELKKMISDYSLESQLGVIRLIEKIILSLEKEEKRWEYLKLLLVYLKMEIRQKDKIECQDCKN